MKDLSALAASPFSEVSLLAHDPWRNLMYIIVKMLLIFTTVPERPERNFENHSYEVTKSTPAIMAFILTTRPNWILNVSQYNARKRCQKVTQIQRMFWSVEVRTKTSVSLVQWLQVVVFFSPSDFTFTNSAWDWRNNQQHSSWFGNWALIQKPF